MSEIRGFIDAEDAGDSFSKIIVELESEKLALEETNRRLRSLIEKGFPKLLEHMEYDLADEYDRALHPKGEK